MKDSTQIQFFEPLGRREHNRVSDIHVELTPRRSPFRAAWDALADREEMNINNR